MEIKLSGNTVSFHFEYKPKTVALIKTIPSVRFNAPGRFWYCDRLLFTPSMLQTLTAYGFSSPEGMLGQLAANAPVLEAPSASEQSKKPYLYPFQAQGVNFLASRGSALLGDEAGVGKTPQLIALTSGANKVLVLTMASLKFQFENEIKKFEPGLSTLVINGDKEERDKLWRSEAQYYIANYELLLRDLPAILSRTYDYIIADECTRLSKHTNKQYKALKQVKSRYRIPATGTAISNSPLDAYGIFEWIKPGLLGNYYHFINSYVVKDTWGGVKFFKNLDQLAAIIKPYYIRRTKTQVLPELPEKIKTEIPFELSEKERKLYDQIKAELLFDIEKISISKIDSPVMMQNTVVKLLRLRQLANGMELIGDHLDSTKLKVLKDLLATLNGGKKIIFSEFAEMCKILKRELPHSEMIIGEVDTLARQKIVEKFNTDPDCKILVMSSAGAFGLNLQAASVIIHFDLPFSVAKYEQRAARAHRAGQKETVYEYSLIGKHTVDQFVLKKLESKQAISDRLMPVSELKELLTT